MSERSLLPEWSEVPLPVIGMLHLSPLPGSPGYRGDVDSIRAALLEDAAALVEGGVHGVMIENFGDQPYSPGPVGPEVVSHMTALAAEVTRLYDVPLGVDVLRNDGLSAMAIAHAVGGRFIRVNVLIGARLTDQGIVGGIAHQLLRYRRFLDADIKILADIRVKHSAAISDRELAEEVEETIERGAADGLIVSGSMTGAAIDMNELRAVAAAAGSTPVFVGSGVTPELAPSLESVASGIIVGSYVKRNAKARERVVLDRVRELVRALGREATRPGSG